MTIRLVVTDLGGTSWAGDDAIPASTNCAIDALVRRGVTLLVATARGELGVMPTEVVDSE